MLGFDIGGTKCAVSVGVPFEDGITITDKRIIPTDLSISPYEMIDRMCASAEEMTDDCSLIGISCGGPLDSKQGIILSPPNLVGWDEVKIVEYLEKRYGGHAYLQNDANACALAEWRFGAGRGTESMVFLTCGTGMGAGIVINGRIYEGACDAAGEVGHMRLAKEGPVGFGKAGSFEGFCSGGGIGLLGRAMARKRLERGETLPYCATEAQLGDINAAVLAKYARLGDPVAVQAYKTAGKRLGQALAILIDVLNPEKIVIGSVFVRSEDLLRGPMQKVLEKETLPASLAACQVVGAALGEQIGDYAALTVAVEGEKYRR